MKIKTLIQNLITRFYFIMFGVILIITLCFTFLLAISRSNNQYLRKQNIRLASTEFAGKIDQFVALDENDLFLIEQSGEILSLKSKILKSTDGGKSWKENLFVENQNFHSLYFFNRNIGFTSAKSEKTVFLYKTEDNGNSWQLINRSIPDYINEIQFVDVTTGFILCDNGSLLKTYDGGRNWEEVKPLINDVKSFYFTNKLTGWIITQKGDLFRTQNGGKSWTTEPVKFSSALTKWKPNKISIVKIKFINSKEGYLGVRFKTTKLERSSDIPTTENYITYDGGVIFTTKNAGESWKLNLVTTKKGLTDFSASNSSKIWCLPDYIWKESSYFISSNNGKSWQKHAFNGVEGDPYHIYFASDKVGWVITSGGNFDYLFRTEDGGVTWR